MVSLIKSIKKIEEYIYTRESNYITLLFTEGIPQNNLRVIEMDVNCHDYYHEYDNQGVVKKFTFTRDDFDPNYALKLKKYFTLTGLDDYFGIEPPQDIDVFVINYPSDTRYLVDVDDPWGGF
jgi:hypothetical protein